MSYHLISSNTLTRVCERYTSERIYDTETRCHMLLSKIFVTEATLKHSRQYPRSTRWMVCQRQQQQQQGPRIPAMVARCLWAWKKTLDMKVVRPQNEVSAGRVGTCDVSQPPAQHLRSKLGALVATSLQTQKQDFVFTRIHISNIPTATHPRHSMYQNPRRLALTNPKLTLIQRAIPRCVGQAPSGGRALQA